VPKAIAFCPQFLPNSFELRRKVAAGCRHDSRQDGGATTEKFKKLNYYPSNLRFVPRLI